MSDIVYTEKACSWCNRLNWDSENGFYNERCTSDEHEGEFCNIEGEIYNFDADNKPIQ